jgi:hypothetical protein
MSRFENVSHKNLKKILTIMDEYIDRRGNPKSLFDYRNDRAIRDAMEIIGFDISNEDLNFLIQLKKINPNYTTEEINVPTLKVVEVVTERHATIRVKEWWSRQINTYIDEDNLGNFIEDMSDDEWWEGKKVDEETYDEETTSSEVVETKRIK